MSCEEGHSTDTYTFEADYPMIPHRPTERCACGWYWGVKDE
jgi:hypothetical protein